MNGIALDMGTQLPAQCALLFLGGLVPVTVDSTSFAVYRGPGRIHFTREYSDGSRTKVPSQ